MPYCKICDSWSCDKHYSYIGKVKDLKSFVGSSPPEVFVGRWNYPNVYAGILSPEEKGDTRSLSSPEEWHKQKLSISQILNKRNKLIYGRTQNNIKNLNSEFMKTMKEVAMAHESVSTAFILKKSIEQQKEHDSKVPLISHAAEIEKVSLEENPKIKQKVEYLVGDTEIKATDAISELDKAGIETSSIIKILSAGLLGNAKNRKLVPTRWSITAIDDTLSKQKIKKIRYYKEINEILVFHAEYLGNHYEFLLLPDKYSFEVIEHSLKNNGFWHDYELFQGRNSYAEDVTGAYYANRLALAEYLEKVKSRAQCVVLREISAEYSSPLGVGILREISRDAFSKKPEKYNNLGEAFKEIQKRLKTDIQSFTQKSMIIKDYGKQKRLSQYF